MIQGTEQPTLRRRAAENLRLLQPHNEIATAALATVPTKLAKISQKRPPKAAATRNLNQQIADLEQRLTTTNDAVMQRRLASRLATLQPGHPQAIEHLLQLLLSQNAQAIQKRVVEDLKTVLLDEQLPEVVTRLKAALDADGCVDAALPQSQAARSQEGYKLLWYCAQRLTYPRFSASYHPAAP
jgi:hypothetical protein